MAGPWEDYQQQDDGPWSDYQPAPASDASAPTPALDESLLARPFTEYPLAAAAHNLTRNVSSHLIGGFHRLTGDEEGYAREVAEREAREADYGPLRERHPIQTFAGEVIPTMAVPLGAFGTIGAKLGAPAIPGIAGTVARTADAAVTGAAIGGLGSEDFGEGAKWGAAGGVAGKAIGDFVESAARFGRRFIPDPVAERLGFRQTPAEMAGNRGAELFEAGVESNFLTGSGVHRIRQHNQTNLNRIAAKAIGVSDEAVSDDGFKLTAKVLDEAESRITGVYKELFDNDVNVFINRNDTSKAFRDVVANSALTLDELTSNSLIKTVGDALSKTRITRREIQSLSSKLGKRAKSLVTTPQGDRDLGLAMFDLKEVVDDILHSSLNPAQKEAFTQARGQYRSLMQLLGTEATTSGGNVNYKSLASRLFRTDKKGFRLGRNESDLYEAVRYLTETQPRIGDSGTAPRLGLPTVGGGLAAAGYFGDPIITPALVGTGAYAAGRAYPLSAALARYSGNLASIMNPEYVSRAARGGVFQLQD